ncbi:TetR/AcrR family transcriptional regulator [Nocardia sp. NPDC050697]|uniref:TetR/AcrR family transcriptional regulator n=1 Tax=Nocardia sp. NPDC050697 TaxID=3155158 RepID=UPI0033C7161A
MTDASGKPQGREAQRLRTRDRVLDAAITEFARTGSAEADIAAIAEAAGVARGTFYFHFPTKEHVLLELERREETLLAQKLTRFLRAEHDLRGALAETVRLVLALERRLGNTLFRELLAVHFSPNRGDGDPRDFPMIATVATEIENARDRGETRDGIDPYHAALFFLLGLYALLATTPDNRAMRAGMLDSYLTTALHSMER